nr:hypothetical protein [uncultured Moellerella sp.]
MNSANRASTLYVVGHENTLGSNINSCDAITSDAVKFNQESPVFDANTGTTGVTIISKPFSWTLCSETKAVIPGAYKGAINYNLVLK